MRLLFFRSRTERSFSVTSLTCTLIAFCTMLGTVLSISGCGGGSDDGGGPTPGLSPSPSPSASPTPIQKSVSFDVTWGPRTRGGFNGGSINSAQSAQFSFYEGTDRTNGPKAVVKVNRTANGDSYTATYTTGDSTLNARRICLVDAVFYPQPDQQGTPVAGATMQSHINIDSGKLQDTISLVGEIKNVTVLTTTAFVNETTDVNVSTTNQFGTTIPVTPGSITLAIKTGTENLALVGGTGPNEPLHIRGLRPGSATITASVDGATSSPANIIVDSHAAIVITPSDATVSLEKQITLSAIVSGVPDSAGADGKKVTWSVITAEGGSITPDGVYTAPKKEGDFVVQAQSVFDPTKKATVTVKVASGVAVSITPDVATIGWQQSIPLVAHVSNTSDQSVTWAVDGNNGTITPDGVYTAPKKDGTYTITATSKYDPRRSAQVKITVVSNSEVLVTPATANLSWLGTTTFTAKVANVPETDKGVIWTVDGGSANGFITSEGVYTAPKRDGTYTITATSTFDNRKQGSATVTVASNKSVTITPPTADLSWLGTVAFQAQVTGSPEAETGVTWSVDGGSITVDGVYTSPKADGTYTITATSTFDTRKQATAKVTVVSNKVVKITPTEADLSWLESLTFNLQVTGSPEAETGVTWSVDGGTITGDGVYTAPKTDGTYTVTATSTFDTRKQSTAKVTVSSHVNVTVKPGADVKVNVKETKQFTAAVTRFVGEGGVTWSVEPDAGGAAVGTISQTGLYTAPSQRQLVYIRATSKFDPSRFARVPVQVTAGGADVTVE